MIEEIASLGTILGVWAHPDDEAYLSAGIMSVAASLGQRVVCVTATRGELGFPDDDPRPLDVRAALRTTELDACLATLGVDDHRWLEYPDGGCQDVDEREPVEEIAAIVRDVRPDTVLTFGPDGMTGHTDHITVSRWTARARAAGGSDARLLYATKTKDWVDRFLALTVTDQVMMDDEAQIPALTPAEIDLAVELDDRSLDVKLRALRAQASQVQPLIDAVGIDGFDTLNRGEFFRNASADDWPTDR